MSEADEDKDPIKEAERRGYTKGYNAGRLWKQNAITQERMRRENQAFMDRAFLAILPVAMNVQGWTFRDRPINSTEDRVLLAAKWAEEAAKQRPIA